jgi:UDP:flavonoid glycosyltransferase YjiC (YdhE family)
MASTPISNQTKRKILVCCFGSRGDVQPFAALARGLQDEGFDVLGTTNVNDGISIFESLGVRAEGVHFDMAEFLRKDPKMKKAMATGNAIQFGMTMSNAFKEHFPKEFSSQWEVARKFRPDLIVASTLMFVQASSIGQALRVPVVHADLASFSFLPISKHTETEFHESRFFHKMASFVCVVAMLIPYHQKNKDGDSLYGTIRKDVFSPAVSGGGGLPESERLLGQDGGGQYAREWMNPMTPNLFAISDSVLPKSRFDDLPPLFSERSIWTGNWYVSKNLQEELARTGDPNFSNKTTTSEGSKTPEDDTQTIVLGFIEGQKQLREAAGQPAIAPVYIGWGSMVAVSPEHMTRVAVQSLVLAGLPGIVLGGFAKLNIGLLKGETDKDLYDYATKHVLFLQSAPHDWLFPHCSMTVHHGGAGTTAAALRSGVPTIVTPCIADQFDNAALVRAAGCGLGFKKPLRKTSEAQLADAIKKCVRSAGGTEDRIFFSNCKRVAEALEEENGIKNAVGEIDTFMKTRLDSGQWKEEFEARLEQRAEAPWSLRRALYRVMFYKDPFVEN